MDWQTALLAAAALGAVAAFVALRRRRGAAQTAERRRPTPLAPSLTPPVEGDLTVVLQGGVGSARMHYLIAGAPASEAPPLVLIHGLGGSIRHFSGTLMPELAQTHRVVAFDRPGYGASTRPAEGAARLQEQAAALRSAVQQLGLSRPVLVGHSFGGAVALAYALDYPEDASGLVLLAPAAFPFRMKPPLSDQTVDSAAMRRALAYTIGPLVARKNAETTVNVAFAPQKPPADYAEAGGGRLAHRPSQLEATMEDGALLRPDLAALAARYPRLKAPAAMLFGMADQILTYEDHGPPLKRAAPHVILRTLDGVGHMLPFVAEADCIEMIRSVAGSKEARRRWRGEALADA